MAKILLYVQNVECLAQYRDRLLQYGHEVVCATDGRDSCEKFHLYKPDVVVVDYDMPRISGVEFSIYLRNNGVTTPVIIFSSSNKIPAGQSPNSSFTDKTIPQDDLASRVDEIIKLHKTLHKKDHQPGREHPYLTISR